MKWLDLVPKTDKIPSPMSVETYDLLMDYVDEVEKTFDTDEEEQAKKAAIFAEHVFGDK